MSELRAAKQSQLDRAELKATELAEKDALVREYLDRVVKLTEERAAAEAKARDAGSEMARLSARVARMQQEKELADKHNEWLSNELAVKSDALLAEKKAAAAARTDTESELSAAQGKVETLEAQYAAANARIAAFEAAEKDLHAKNKELGDQAASVEEHYERELATSRRLNELYKSKSDDILSKNAELEGIVASLKEVVEKTAKDSGDKIQGLETALKMSREEVAAARSEAEKARAEAATAAASTPLGGAVSGAARDILSLSPAAAAASMMRDGKSLTSIFERCESLENELVRERAESRRLQESLDSILAELERKAPAIQQQRAEYESMLETHAAMLARLEDAASEARRHANNAMDAEREANNARRELAAREAQAKDLGHQVAVLLVEVEALKGGALAPPAGATNSSALVPSGDKPGSAGALISERLVSFKDVADLQEQNAKLLMSLRSLSAEAEAGTSSARDEAKKEFEAKAADMMAELERLKASRKRQESAVEAIVRQRDL